MKKRSQKHAKQTNQAKSNQSNQIRIIGGRYKRSNIRFIDANGLRPTPDRVRETLFNWLMHDIYGANVLDACAGSGVLGFEALSRGADSVTFIESNSQQSQQLTKTTEQLKIPSHQVTVLNAQAEKAIITLNAPVYDIVFIDPPYSLNLWQAILEGLIAQSLINQDSYVYIEADKPLELLFNQTLLSKITIIKHKNMGQVFGWLIQLL